MKVALKTCALVAMLLMSAAAVTAAPEAPVRFDIVWHLHGPGGGGWIQSVSLSPFDVNIIYVGCDVGGFYRSTDGGKSYTIHNDGLRDRYVECIAPDPKSANVIYLGCLSGVYRSDDDGDHWKWLRNGFPPIAAYSFSAPIGTLAIDPSNPKVVYAGIGRPREHTSGQGAVYKTTDRGEHWELVNAKGQLPDKALVSSILIDPRNSADLLIATDAGVFRSSDGGQHWMPSNDGLPQTHARRLARCAAKPDVVYLTIEAPHGVPPWRGGVYRSDDDGRTWRACNNGLSQQVGKVSQPGPMTSQYDQIVVDPASPDIAIVGGRSWVNAGPYRTMDGGRTWQALRKVNDPNFDAGWITFWGPAVECLAMSPLDPKLLVYGSSGHLLETRDGGDHWSPIYSHTNADGTVSSIGLEVTCVHNLCFDPANPQLLFAGYYDIGLMVSRDGGVSFARLMDGVPRDDSNSCFQVTVDPDKADRWWAAFGQWSSNTGILARRDGTTPWTRVGTPETGLPVGRCRAFFLDRRSSVDQRRILAVLDDHGFFETRDGGATWQARNSGLPSTTPRGLVIALDNPDHLWTVVPGGKDGLGAVYSSDDGAQSWRKVSVDLPVGDAKDLIVAPKDPQRLYYAQREGRLGGKSVPGGVWRSDDGGIHWRQIFADRFVQSLAVDPRSADRLFIGTNDHPYHDESAGHGVFLTEDGGATWESLNSASLSSYHVSAIRLSPSDPNHVFVATGGNSFFDAMIPPLR